VTERRRFGVGAPHFVRSSNEPLFSLSWSADLFLFFKAPMQHPLALTRSSWPASAA
jgi:hypothetical protein